MKEIGYGRDYIYTPANPSAKQTFMPQEFEGTRLFDAHNTVPTADDPC